MRRTEWNVTHISLLIFWVFCLTEVTYTVCILYNLFSKNYLIQAVIVGFIEKNKPIWTNSLQYYDANCVNSRKVYVI